MNIIIGSDHAGYNTKKLLTDFLNTEYNKKSILDVGPFNEISCDYPDFSKKLCQKMNDHCIGILICGSGIGIILEKSELYSINLLTVSKSIYCLVKSNFILIFNKYM